MFLSSESFSKCAMAVFISSTVSCMVACFSAMTSSVKVENFWSRAEVDVSVVVASSAGTGVSWLKATKAFLWLK